MDLFVCKARPPLSSLKRKHNTSLWCVAVLFCFSCFGEKNRWGRTWKGEQKYEGQSHSWVNLNKKKKKSRNSRSDLSALRKGSPTRLKLCDDEWNQRWDKVVCCLFSGMVMHLLFMKGWGQPFNIAQPYLSFGLGYRGQHFIWKETSPVFW